MLLLLCTIFCLRVRRSKEVRVHCNILFVLLFMFKVKKKQANDIYIRRIEPCLLLLSTPNFLLSHIKNHTKSNMCVCALRVLVHTHEFFICPTIHSNRKQNIVYVNLQAWKMKI